MQPLVRKIGTLLSSYTQAINRQEDRTGSLFQKKTQAKRLDVSEGYPFICFQYIHQNPMKAGLVDKIDDWHYSSFKDYAGLRKGTLCNLALAKTWINVDENNFMKESYQVIDQGKLEYIW